MVIGIKKKFVYPHYVYVIHICSTEYDKTRDVNRKAQVTPYKDTTKYMINEVEIVREAVHKIFPSHSKSGTLHMYTHAVGKGHRPVTHEALTKTFDEIDEFRGGSIM